MSSCAVERGHATSAASFGEAAGQEAGWPEERFDTQHAAEGGEQGVPQRRGDAPKPGAASAHRRRLRGGPQEWPGCTLDQQRRDGTRKQPTAGQGLVLGRQPARTKQAFEALGGELDVPAKTVRLQRIARGHLGGQRGGQHQVARGPHRQRLQGAVRAAPVLPAVLRLRPVAMPPAGGAARPGAPGPRPRHGTCRPWRRSRPRPPAGRPRRPSGHRRSAPAPPAPRPRRAGGAWSSRSGR